MRSSILFALIVGLFLVVGPAPQTEAGSSVHLVLLNAAEYECEGDPGGPTTFEAGMLEPAQTGVQDGACVAGLTDHLNFAITFDIAPLTPEGCDPALPSVNPDSCEGGTNAWSIDLAWDEQLQSSLGLIAVHPTTSFTRGFENPTPPPEFIGYSSLDLGEITHSSASEAGRIDQVSGAVTQELPGMLNDTSFRAGTVTFEVLKTDATNLTLGFYRTDGAVMGDTASGFITPNFGAFSINAPEPSGTLLALASLSSVAFLASRRRRSD